MNSPQLGLEDLHQDETPSNASKKRKTAGASGRGVATLTPEQLEKKRANDREAQRAIRERTKDKIESLEREIRELTSQQPYQELQSIIRLKDAVLAENEDIRRRLASVITILQPLLGAHPLSGENASTNTNANAIGNGNNSNIHPSLSLSTSIADLAQAAQHNVQPALNQPGKVNLFQQDQYMNAAHPRSAPTVTAQSRYSSPYHSSEQDPSQDAQSWANQRVALDNQRETMQRSHELSENGERLNFSFLIDSAQPSNHIFAPAASNRRNSPETRSSYPAFADRPSQSTTHAWNMLPKNCPPTCPLDRILLDFQRERRANTSHSSGSSQTPAYTSPAYPSISNLLNPTHTTTPDTTSSPSLGQNTTKLAALHKPSDPLSTLMTDIISKFPNISGLPEQVATTFIMFIYMRWQVYPTQENYERLPDWLTPRPSQLFSPHPAWMDHLPWPRMRDKLVHNHADYQFESWFLPFTSGLSVNWPYEAHDCLISTGDPEDPIINPVFERHIYRLDNWTLGPMFTAAFPALADTVHVRDKGNSSLNTSIPLDGNQMPQGLANISAGMGLSMYQGAQVQQQTPEQVAPENENSG